MGFFLWLQCRPCSFGFREKLFHTHPVQFGKFRHSLPTQDQRHSRAAAIVPLLPAPIVDPDPAELVPDPVGSPIESADSRGADCAEEGVLPRDRCIRLLLVLLHPGNDVLPPWSRAGAAPMARWYCGGGSGDCSVRPVVVPGEAGPEEAAPGVVVPGVVGWLRLTGAPSIRNTDVQRGAAVLRRSAAEHAPAAAPAAAPCAAHIAAAGTVAAAARIVVDGTPLAARFLTGFDQPPWYHRPT
mmetsp:Transcript_62105/g.72614  ORF Transcript_62105/g.72614 Transcript_62105/m.72614 type:complete len:241 (+) Transcript_62105:1133-1855(+)